MVAELAERAGGRPALSEASGVSLAALESYAQGRRSPGERSRWLLHLAREGDDPVAREERVAGYAARVAAGLEPFTGEPRRAVRCAAEVVAELALADEELPGLAAMLDLRESIQRARCLAALLGEEDDQGEE